MECQDKATNNLFCIMLKRSSNITSQSTYNINHMTSNTNNNKQQTHINTHNIY